MKGKNQFECRKHEEMIDVNLLVVAVKVPSSCFMGRMREQIIAIDIVPEWLRGWTRNPLGSPAQVRILLMSFFFFFFRRLFLREI